MVAPLVISRPMPRSDVSVASVMMKGGRPILDDAEAVEDADRDADQQRDARSRARSATPCVDQQRDDDAGRSRRRRRPTGRCRPVMMTKVCAEREDRDHRALAQQVRRCCARSGSVGVANDRTIHSSSQQAEQRQAEQEAVCAAPRSACRLRLAIVGRARRPSLLDARFRRRWPRSRTVFMARLGAVAAPPAGRAGTRAACRRARRLRAGRTRSG